MEFECTKYKEKVDAEKPVCPHPGDYCQFRSSCMIHFMEGEERRSTKSVDDASEKKEESSG